MYDLTKTLFVSDLDGTLLGSDGKLSQGVAEDVNRMIKEGVKFTFATARSYTSAMWVASELEPEIPIILHNGVFIKDKKKGIISSHLLKNPEKIREILKKYKLNPFVYSVSGNDERYSYIPASLTNEAAAYQAKRVNDPRDNPLFSEAHMWDGDIYHVLVIDNGDRVKDAYNCLKDEYNCLLTKDYYSGDTWLEIFSNTASKASAVIKLRDMLGCERTVVFGDGANDISMFKAADEGYAVIGACNELKAVATGIIGSCDDGAVVKWLREHTLKN